MELQNSLDTQDTIINDNMTQSLDDYYCDDYDDNEQSNTQDLITCDNCGNRWDGYAQCNCYQIKCYDLIESDDEQDLEKQNLENPARKAAFEKTRAKNYIENNVNPTENDEDTFVKINNEVEDINNEN